VGSQKRDRSPTQESPDKMRPRQSPILPPINPPQRHYKETSQRIPSVESPPQRWTSIKTPLPLPPFFPQQRTSAHEGEFPRRFSPNTPTVAPTSLDEDQALIASRFSSFDPYQDETPRGPYQRDPAPPSSPHTLQQWGSPAQQQGEEGMTPSPPTEPTKHLSKNPKPANPHKPVEWEDMTTKQRDHWEQHNGIKPFPPDWRNMSTTQKGKWLRLHNSHSIPNERKQTIQSSPESTPLQRQTTATQKLPTSSPSSPPSLSPHSTQGALSSNAPLPPIEDKREARSPNSPLTDPKPTEAHSPLTLPSSDYQLPDRDPMELPKTNGSSPASLSPVSTQRSPTPSSPLPPIAPLSGTHRPHPSPMDHTVPPVSPPYTDPIGSPGMSDSLSTSLSPFSTQRALTSSSHFHREPSNLIHPRWILPCLL
jgi:hypothetical protein